MRNIQYTTACNIADKEIKPTEKEKQAMKKDKLIERYLKKGEKSENE